MQWERRLIRMNTDSEIWPISPLIFTGFKSAKCSIGGIWSQSDVKKEQHRIYKTNLGSAYNGPMTPQIC